MITALSFLPKYYICLIRSLKVKTLHHYTFRELVVLGVGAALPISCVDCGYMCTLSTVFKKNKKKQINSILLTLRLRVVRDF